MEGWSGVEGLFRLLAAVMQRGYVFMSTVYGFGAECQAKEGGRVKREGGNTYLR